MKSQAQKLASEQCRRILEVLNAGPKSLEELVRLTKLTQGSVEKYTEVLLEAGLVNRRAGKITAKR
jgi:DNA-binding IclR family transcriptional regulator